MLEESGQADVSVMRALETGIGRVYITGIVRAHKEFSASPLPSVCVSRLIGCCGKDAAVLLRECACKVPMVGDGLINSTLVL